MSTTLTNGLKLPDKGSVDWYADMQSNYAILDGAVGTVAEHTTALAGKAPAVHTHTVSQITDFPAYGTTAGTICEGNDSRLSDARTPVAHTHTKSDVTDLLNSNFIPSANNSYDLGSSSYQWNNLYAKNYYYNGVAWGLNVKNIWTHYNVINGYRFEIRQTSQEIGVLPTSSQWNGFNFVDKNEQSTISFQHAFLPAETRFSISIVDNVASHDSDSTVWIEFLRLSAYSGGSGFIVGAEIRPSSNNLNLGTSTNKWKTLNGVNPGALSLPNFSAEFDVSGQIVPPTGETQINIAWGKNTFTPSVDGWLSIRIHKATVIKIYREARASYCFDSRIATADDICVCSPVVAGVEYTIKIQATQFSSGYDHFRLSPCQGNV